MEILILEGDALYALALLLSPFAKLAKLNSAGGNS